MTVCPESFYLLQDYLDHLQEKSDEQSSIAPEKAIKLTEICVEIEKVNKVKLQDTCEFGEFRCLHCEDGFNDIGEY